MSQHLYHRAYMHSLDYYYSVLNVLICGLKNGLTHQVIAGHLNRACILTPVGLQWNSSNVKTTLKRIRNHAQLPKSKIHTALLELILQGNLTTREAMPLFRVRVPALL
jgi:hypothetical protein